VSSSTYTAGHSFVGVSGVMPTKLIRMMPPRSSVTNGDVTV
jgi:hypothetical protein